MTTLFFIPKKILLFGVLSFTTLSLLNAASCVFNETCSGECYNDENLFSMTTTEEYENLLPSIADKEEKDNIYSCLSEIYLMRSKITKEIAEQGDGAFEAVTTYGMKEEKISKILYSEKEEMGEWDTCIPLVGLCFELPMILSVRDYIAKAESYIQKNDWKNAQYYLFYLLSDDKRNGKSKNLLDEIYEKISSLYSEMSQHYLNLKNENIVVSSDDSEVTGDNEVILEKENDAQEETKPNYKQLYYKRFIEASNRFVGAQVPDDEAFKKGFMLPVIDGKFGDFEKLLADCSAEDLKNLETNVKKGIRTIGLKKRDWDDGANDVMVSFWKAIRNAKDQQEVSNR